MAPGLKLTISLLGPAALGAVGAAHAASPEVAIRTSVSIFFIFFLPLSIRGGVPGSRTITSADPIVDKSPTLRLGPRAYFPLGPKSYILRPKSYSA